MSQGNKLFLHLSGQWYTVLGIDPFNPLSPNSDQDQFSPNNIHALSRDKS